MPIGQIVAENAFFGFAFLEKLRDQIGSQGFAGIDPMLSQQK